MWDLLHFTSRNGLNWHSLRSKHTSINNNRLDIAFRKCNTHALISAKKYLLLPSTFNEHFYSSSAVQGIVSEQWCYSVFYRSYCMCLASWCFNALYETAPFHHDNLSVLTYCTWLPMVFCLNHIVFVCTIDRRPICLVCAYIYIYIYIW